MPSRSRIPRRRRIPDPWRRRSPWQGCRRRTRRPPPCRRDPPQDVPGLECVDDSLALASRDVADGRVLVENPLQVPAARAGKRPSLPARSVSSPGGRSSSGRTTGGGTRGSAAGPRASPNSRSAERRSCPGAPSAGHLRTGRNGLSLVYLRSCSLPNPSTCAERDAAAYEQAEPA